MRPPGERRPVSPRLRRGAEEASKVPERSGAFCFGAFVSPEHRGAPGGSEGAGDAALGPRGRTVKRRKNEILAYPPGRTTNGCTEGGNRKIQLLKRISYGFKSREVYVRKMRLAFVPFAHLKA
ncbi:MAG: transposase [Clostridiales bacterium]|nr:transposase [Clostridiales bacterium]